MPTERQVAAFGPKAHTLTREERARGARTTNEKKRELGKTVRERFADRLQEDADRIYDAFMAAVDQQDWRGAAELLNQAFGRPAGQLELSGHVDNVVTISVSSALAVPPLDELDGAPLLLEEADDAPTG